MAKATLRDKADADPLSPLVIDVAKRVLVKQGAAAAVLEKDEGNYSRDAKAGRLTTGQLAKLGPVFLAELGRELVEQFAPLATPAARIRKLADEQERIAAELRQLSEYVA